MGIGTLALLLLAIVISADLRSTGLSVQALPEAAHRLPNFTVT